MHAPLSPHNCGTNQNEQLPRTPPGHCHFTYSTVTGIPLGVSRGCRRPLPKWGGARLRGPARAQEGRDRVCLVRQTMDCGVCRVVHSLHASAAREGARGPKGHGGCGSAVMCQGCVLTRWTQDDVDLVGAPVDTYGNGGVVGWR